METSTSNTARRQHRERGFSLIEMMIAITVLAVGMLGLAALLSQMDKTTGKSRYMGMEALLASEKLEQLNRYPVRDANLIVAVGSTAGSLTEDTSSGAINYFDEVLVSTGDGIIAETTTGKDADGKTIYTSITQSPSGEIQSSTSSTVPENAGSVSFKRRWLIEKDTPVVGVCRVTVMVLTEDGTEDPTKRLQMSMVRQYAN